MTIKYKNNYGLSFIINVLLRSEREVSVEIDLFSTKTPFLHKQKYRIPYGHQGIIPPFDFNNLEEGIRDLLDLMYQESPPQEFKHEDMVEAIDILMMTEARVIDISLDEKFTISSSSTV
ncbi:beta C1 [Hedyotis yellow mosaic betasatellite]|uniref:Beta C1 n=1 Tax=Hedyotis yellow mosaic betasatellite TaxID=1428189 RepID=V5RDY2_9VIRU|nr:beta C1 [Hedyotis yellow mosaic betasatellite]AHB33494.1 beta C1 [Hedyotis yellow mosaic betasatellite]